MYDKYKKIKMIILDVDGTLTDGGIYYGDNNIEIKKFNVKDAAGIFAAQKSGIKIMVLTGRKSEAVERRMRELKVDFLYQGIKDKIKFICQFMKENSYSKENIAYIGDDLNDYPCMKIAGFVGCPKDACEEVKNISDYVSVYQGGYGAVRDVICYLLKKRNQWNDSIIMLYGIDFGI